MQRQMGGGFLADNVNYDYNVVKIIGRRGTRVYKRVILRKEVINTSWTKIGKYREVEVGTIEGLNGVHSIKGVMGTSENIITTLPYFAITDLNNFDNFAVDIMIDSGKVMVSNSVGINSNFRNVQVIVVEVVFY